MRKYTNAQQYEINLKRIELLKIYNSSKNRKELCDLLEIKSRTLSELRKKSGIKSPFFEKGGRIKHKAKINISDFDLGWCLGFFAADGCLYTNFKIKNTISRIDITLAIKDKDCLFKFFDTLLEDIDISDFRIKPPTLGKTDKIAYTATMPAFENVIHQFLIFTNKTYDLRINIETFSTATENFRLGFLRGVTDGDGWVAKTGHRISIVSASKGFIEDLQYFFGGKISKRKKEYWDLHFNKDAVQELLIKGINDYPHITLTRKDERLNNHVWNTQQKKML